MLGRAVAMATHRELLFFGKTFSAFHQGSSILLSAGNCPTQADLDASSLEFQSSLGS